MYKVFKEQPISRVRKGLQLLFDEAREVQSRLEEIEERGYLAGLRMPSMSMLLYWRAPEWFPPYNRRTAKFLKDFQLQRRGESASSPQCYERWRQHAILLSQQLGLPTAGHVDRMTWRYSEDVAGRKK